MNNRFCMACIGSSSHPEFLVTEQSVVYSSLDIEVFSRSATFADKADDTQLVGAFIKDGDDAVAERCKDVGIRGTAKLTNRLMVLGVATETRTLKSEN
jgi:hypothetical protein